MKFKFLCTFSFVFLCMTLFGFPHSSFAETPKDYSFLTQNSEPPNFSQVNTKIFRGGRPSGNSFKYLKNLGVKLVVDLQGGDLKHSDFGWIAGILETGETKEWIQFEKQTFESLGMKFVNVPINSLAPINSSEGFALGRVLAIINQSQVPVYVHCEYGIDRTGLMIALHRVFFEKWPRQKAYDEMVEKGHGWLRQLVTGDMDRFFWAATQGMQ